MASRSRGFRLAFRGQRDGTSADVRALARREAIAGLLALGVAGLPRVGLARPARFPPPDRELMVRVDGGRVYVRVNGDLNGPKPPLVMVHGGPGGNHLGMMDALALADERAVILYDQLDSGKSDWPTRAENWTVPRFVNELGHIRKALGIARWHVFGASWGGTIALEYGARQPDALLGLVLASPLVATRLWLADANALRSTLPPELQFQLTRCEMPEPPMQEECDAAAEAFYARFLHREPMSPAAKAYQAELGRAFNFRLYEAMWGPAEFTASGSLKNYDGTPLLARLDGSRTLFVIGQHDEVRVPTAAAFAAQVPGAELAVVPGAAHRLIADRPAEMVALLRGFLARQDMGARGSARAIAG